MLVSVKNEPIRIAHVTGKMILGGVDSMVMSYYRNVDHEKIQFDFFADGLEPTPYDEEIEALGGRVYKLPHYSDNISGNLKRFREILLQNNYKIVHIHLNTLSVFWLREAKKAGVPIRIAHSHSTAAKGETIRNIMKYSLRPFSRRYPTHYCSCSDYAGCWLFGEKLHKKGEVKKIKNAIDIKQFGFDEAIRNNMRKELGYDDSYVIGHIGRFVYTKNQDFVIDIFNNLLKKQPSARLMLIGDGPDLEKIKEKVNNLNIQDKVLFMGLRRDIPQLMQAMDVFLLPSHYEGLGIVLIEAQAASLPVVASTAVPEEARISDDFEFVDLKDNADIWADKLLSFKDKPRRAEAEVVINAGYDIKTEAVKLQNYYIELAARKV